MRDRRQPTRLVLLALLIAANVLVYGTWPWLRQLPLTADSSEAFIVQNIIRNEAYLERFFDVLTEQKKIFFLGTSESQRPYNLAAQLNSLAPEAPRIVAISKGGTSPIHSALAIARAKREGMRIPPTIFVLNPVYFTQSHDVIDDGWMSEMVRSPLFLQMNHRDVQDYLSTEVKEVYNRHFAMRRLLYPVLVQEYLGNLLYLTFHQPAAEAAQVPVDVLTYRFNDSVPAYDTEKNVWTGREALDRFSKDRWQVSTVEESVNLKGVASIITILKKEPAPVLVLFLPVNRQFYRHHGLRMEEFDRRYQDIRKTLRKLTEASNIYLLDLYDRPQLRFGFRDRMHMDQYGFFQLASYVVKNGIYVRFLEATNAYYSAPPAGAQTIAHHQSCER
jgi:poly-D-alanine transfer protein DltD